MSDFNYDELDRAVDSAMKQSRPVNYQDPTKITRPPVSNYRPVSRPQVSQRPQAVVPSQPPVQSQMQNQAQARATQSQSQFQPKVQPNMNYNYQKPVEQSRVNNASSFQSSMANPSPVTNSMPKMNVNPVNSVTQKAPVAPNVTTSVANMSSSAPTANNNVVGTNNISAVNRNNMNTNTGVNQQAIKRPVVNRGRFMDMVRSGSDVNKTKPMRASVSTVNVPTASIPTTNPSRPLVAGNGSGISQVNRTRPVGMPSNMGVKNPGTYVGSQGQRRVVTQAPMPAPKQSVMSVTKPSVPSLIKSRPMSGYKDTSNVQSGANELRAKDDTSDKTEKLVHKPMTVIQPISEELRKTEPVTIESHQQAVESGDEDLDAIINDFENENEDLNTTPFVNTKVEKRPIGDPMVVSRGARPVNRQEEYQDIPALELKKSPIDTRKNQIERNSIPRQYKETRPKSDQVVGLYDQEAIGMDGIRHAKKSSKGWMKVFAIILILIIAAAGAVYAFYKF